MLAKRYRHNIVKMEKMLIRVDGVNVAMLGCDLGNASGGVVLGIVNLLYKGRVPEDKKICVFDWNKIM